MEEKLFFIVTIIIKVASTAAGFVALFMFFTNRKKVAEDTKKSVADQYHGLTERLDNERKALEVRVEDARKLLQNEKDIFLERIGHNEDTIKQLQMSAGSHGRTIEKLTNVQVLLKREAELCKLQHQITELEMLQLKRHNNFKEWERDKVFVIDDDLDVLEEFAENFAKTSVLDYRGFHEIKNFMHSVQTEKPPIVVLDHHLGGGTKAHDILHQFGYEPEIFIMSSAASLTVYKGGKVRFFIKEDFYVAKITMEILKYLVNKTNENKNE